MELLISIIIQNYLVKKDVYLIKYQITALFQYMGFERLIHGTD